MILNKACFETKIGKLFYIWLEENRSRKIAALSTSKDRIEMYISMLLNNPRYSKKAVIRRKRFPGLEKEISGYFKGDLTKFRISPIFLSGTGFEKRVWKETSSISFGRTISYGELARMCESPGAGRAVGNALGKNPVMIIVPCHRIIKGDGKPGGFQPGIKMKKKLLANEGIVL
jgi:O-6-methylguanine DNA methyltransferase